MRACMVLGLRGASAAPRPGEAARRGPTPAAPSGAYRYEIPCRFIFRAIVDWFTPSARAISVWLP